MVATQVVTSSGKALRAPPARGVATRRRRATNGQTLPIRVTRADDVAAACARIVACVGAARRRPMYGPEASPGATLDVEVTRMPAPHLDGIPLLESGDRLDREEFHRRYELTPDEFKAELLDGTVYVSSPVSLRHTRPHTLLAHWVTSYGYETPGTEPHTELTLILEGDNEPQPDANLRIRPETGGLSREVGIYLHGPVELVAEVAYSSASRDLHLKRTVYERAGCREYVVLVAEPAAVRWWSLEEGRYVELRPGEDGLLRSRVFPGLWLDPTCMLADDAPGVMAALRRGLASPEHVAFVATLAERRPAR